MDPTSTNLNSDPSPVIPAAEADQAQTADTAIPMWVVALIGRQQLELELLRDQLRTQQPTTASTG